MEQVPSHNKDEIELSELFSLISKSKIFIITISISLFLISMIYSITLSDIYRSEALLSVKENGQSSDLLQRYGGLASFAGIDIPTTSQNSADLIIETIKSREFLRRLLLKEEILPKLIASKSFNFEKKEVVFDSNLYDINSKSWVRKPKKNRDVIPSYLEAHEIYIDIISIKKDPLTGYISIHVDHVSPIFSKKLLELIIFESDKQIQEKVLKDTDEALAYLDEELRKEPLNEVRISLSQLIKQKMNIKMTAMISENYSFEVIEPPFLPELKNRPSRAIISLVGGLIGLLFSILFVWMRHYFKNESD